jgi:hypothetical protein
MDRMQLKNRRFIFSYKCAQLKVQRLNEFNCKQKQLAYILACNFQILTTNYIQMQSQGTKGTLL